MNQPERADRTVAIPEPGRSPPEASPEAGALGTISARPGFALDAFGPISCGRAARRAARSGAKTGAARERAGLRARRSDSDAGCLELVEKVVTQPASTVSSHAPDTSQIHLRHLRRTCLFQLFSPVGELSSDSADALSVHAVDGELAVIEATHASEHVRQYSKVEARIAL